MAATTQSSLFSMANSTKDAGFVMFQEAMTTVANQESTASSSLEASDDPGLIRSITIIRFCFLPIVAIGTVTNILNMAVFTRPKMRHMSTSTYFFALAVADFGFMYLELFRIWFEWMDNMVDPATYFSDTYCRLANFLDVSFRDFSNWLIVCITVERLIILAWPLKAKSLCTVPRARLTVLGVIVGVMLAHCHYAIFSKALYVNGWVCWYDPEQARANFITGWWKVALGSTVVISVISLNIILLYLLSRAKKSSIQSTGKDDREDQANRLTRMIVGISVLFLVCELPLACTDIGLKVTSPPPRFRIFLNLAFFLSGINHASNFFLYVWSGTAFRTQLMQLLGCSKPSQGPNSRTSVVNTSSTTVGDSQASDVP